MIPGFATPASWMRYRQTETFNSAVTKLGLALMATLMTSLYLIGGTAVTADAAESSHAAAATCNQPYGPFVYGSQVVGIAATPDDGGYWIVNNAGQVAACGDAAFLGQPSGLNKPIVGIATTPDGAGYYLVASDGGIFSYGDAVFQGSTGSMTLNKPIVGMAVDPLTKGYWLVASDGGIFAYDAPFLGSTGSMKLNQPVVGMAAVANGSGYWFVAADGGIFAYGAPFWGSAGSMHLNQPVVGMASDAASNGYWLVAADGGIFAYNAPFHGSTGNIVLNRPIVGMESNTTGSGYRFVSADCGVFDFGTSGFYGAPTCAAPPAPPPSPVGAYCTASAVPANDGYAGDYNVNVTSNQPDQTATATDATDQFSYPTNSNGSATIFLWYTYAGESITVTVGAARCTTTAQA